MLKELITFFLFKLVSDQDKVSIQELEVDGKHIIEIKVAPQDIEKVIGREGRIFKALRNLINSLDDLKRDIVIDIAT